MVAQELDKVLLCRSLEEIKDALLEAYADLMGLGAFDAVEILVDQGVNVSPTSISWTQHTGRLGRPTLPPPLHRPPLARRPSHHRRFYCRARIPVT